MLVGDRLHAMRKGKNLSTEDIAKRTGLPRCFVSRIENGHLFPAIEAIEKLARALEVLPHHLFYDGEGLPLLPNLPKRKTSDDIVKG